MILPIYSMIDENELVCRAKEKQNFNFKLTKCHFACICTCSAHVCMCMQTHSRTVELFERAKMSRTLIEMNFIALNCCHLILCECK